MNSLGKSLELLDEYCSAVGASSASVEDVAGCLHHVDRLEAELDATINVLNIRNELQRKALERTKLHCDQKLRSVDMKLGQKAKLETTYTVKSVEHVASGKENCQDESKMKAIQFTLLSRGYSEDLDNEEEGAALQETIKSLNQRSAQLRSELALFHDLPQSIPEANAMLQKVRKHPRNFSVDMQRFLQKYYRRRLVMDEVGLPVRYRLMSLSKLSRRIQCTMLTEFPRSFRHPHAQVRFSESSADLHGTVHVQIMPASKVMSSGV